MIERIYIHTPFCETKCHYCDFYSIAAERKRQDDDQRFEAALCSEWAQLSDQVAPRLKSLFFGGGTPSMTPISTFRKLMLSEASGGSLQSRLHSSTEVTAEMNPSSVREEFIKEIRDLGLNRVSMGVQSLWDHELKYLGRVHDRGEALKALQILVNSGITNISCDLIAGVPGQSTEHLRRSMQELLEYGIKHISVYLLTLPPHHKLAKDLPSEEVQLEHYLFIDDFLTGQGMEHYEISNFSRPGYSSQHNLGYWKLDSYLGLGPSAHSFFADQNKRVKNVSSLEKYFRNISEGQLAREVPEVLSVDQQNLESWMLASRLAEGFPESWIRSDRQRGVLQNWLNEGLLMEAGERTAQMERQWRLTPKGFALSEAFVSQISPQTPMETLLTGKHN